MKTRSQRAAENRAHARINMGLMPRTKFGADLMKTMGINPSPPPREPPPSDARWNALVEMSAKAADVTERQVAFHYTVISSAIETRMVYRGYEWLTIQ